jgi:hypothetical protein
MLDRLLGESVICVIPVVGRTPESSFVSVLKT